MQKRLELKSIFSADSSMLLSFGEHFIYSRNASLEVYAGQTEKFYLYLAFAFSNLRLLLEIADFSTECRQLSCFVA